MGRTLISALAAVVIHGAALFFVPFSAIVPGTVSSKDHGIAIQITRLAPEPEKKADPGPAPDMPPQVLDPEEPPPEEKEPPEPFPGPETPPPPSSEVEAPPDPVKLTAKKDLMPKKEDLTLSPPQPETSPPEPDDPVEPESDTEEPDISEPKVPEPVNPAPEIPARPSSDRSTPPSRTVPDPDRSETGTMIDVPSGKTGSTDKNPVAAPPDDRDPSAEQLPLKEAVPLYKQNPPPRYPGNARRRGHAGTVMLLVFVTEKGGVEQIRVLESSGHDSLDRAAETAVADWRFEPGTSGGIPAGMWVKIPITFQLKK